MTDQARETAGRRGEAGGLPTIYMSSSTAHQVRAAVGSDMPRAPCCAPAAGSRRGPAKTGQTFAPPPASPPPQPCARWRRSGRWPAAPGRPAAQPSRQAGGLGADVPLTLVGLRSHGSVHPIAWRQCGVGGRRRKGVDMAKQVQCSPGSACRGSLARTGGSQRPRPPPRLQRGTIRSQGTVHARLIQGC